jgi:hypothetical protein
MLVTASRYGANAEGAGEAAGGALMGTVSFSAMFLIEMKGVEKV